MTERQKLGREIYEISKLIDANIVALKTKATSDYDREALQRHMSSRVAHLKRLQQGLDRLWPNRSSWPAR